MWIKRFRKLSWILPKKTQQKVQEQPTSNFNGCYALFAFQISNRRRIINIKSMTLE